MQVITIEDEGEDLPQPSSKRLKKNDYQPFRPIKTESDADEAAMYAKFLRTQSQSLQRAPIQEPWNHGKVRS